MVKGGGGQGKYVGWGVKSSIGLSLACVPIKLQHNNTQVTTHVYHILYTHTLRYSRIHQHLMGTGLSYVAIKEYHLVVVLCC